MSQERILTTHTGSLPRPEDLSERMLEFDTGANRDTAGLWEAVAEATREVVRRQAEMGLDIVSDGEYGKSSYAGYVKERLTGFEGEPRSRMRPTPESEEFPDWVRTTAPRVVFPGNNGPVSLRDSGAVRRDIANFKAALEGVNVADAFMTAASPGVVDTFMPSSYYATEEEFLKAIADAMRDEYKAIVDAGFVLQIDCPDLAMSRHSRFSDRTFEDFLQTARMHINVLNAALEGLPRERMRLHTCWGNYEGPHNHDVELRSIIDILLEANVGAISIEAANPRHAHEWKLFEDVKLPSGVKLVPGVIDSCTNYIEHPDLVAERLVRFASVVGRENVIASTDCGFGTSVGRRHVAPSIAWAKLQSLVDGAKLASKELWGQLAAV